MADKNIIFYVEGNVDKALYDKLGVSSEKTSGIQKIAKYMEGFQKDYNKIVLGMIDKDKKNVPSYFDKFEDQKELCNEYFSFKRHSDYKHFLIILLPTGIEQWLLNCAKSKNIDPKSFKLPDNSKDLKKITEKEGISKNTDFRDFLDAIKDTEPMLLLKEVLKNLKMEKIE